MFVLSPLVDSHSALSVDHSANACAGPSRSGNVFLEQPVQPVYPPTGWYFSYRYNAFLPMGQ